MRSSYIILFPIFSLIAGSGMYLFTKNFFKDKKNPIPIGIAFCYALSGYMTNYGLYFLYGFAAAIFPFVMIALYQLFSKKSLIFYSLLMIFISLVSPWISLMILLFTGIYALVVPVDNIFSDNDRVKTINNGTVKTIKNDTVKTIKNDTVKTIKNGAVNKIRTFMIKLIIDVAALLLSIPVHASSLNAPDFPLSRMSGSFFDVLKALLSGTKPSRNLEYGYGIDIMCGAFVIFLFLAFIFNKKVKLYERLSLVLLTLLMLISAIYDTGNYFFNGFHYTDDNQVYFGFIIVFMLLFISARELADIKETKGIFLITSFVLSLGLIVPTALYSTHYDSFDPFKYTTYLMLIYGVFVLFYKSDNLKSKVFNLIFSILMIIEICFFSFCNLTERDSVTYKNYLKATIDTLMEQNDLDYSNALILDNDETSVNPVTNMLYGYDNIISLNKSMITRPVSVQLSNDLETRLKGQNSDANKDHSAAHQFFSVLIDQATDFNPLQLIHYDPRPASAELSSLDRLTAGNVGKTNTDSVNTLIPAISIYKNPYSLHGYYLPKEAAESDIYSEAFFSSINKISNIIMYGSYQPDDTSSDIFNIERDITFNFVPQAAVDANNHINHNHQKIGVVCYPDKDGRYYNYIYAGHYLGQLSSDEFAFTTEEISTRRYFKDNAYVQYAYFNVDNFIKLHDLLASTKNPYKDYLNLNNEELTSDALLNSLNKEEALFYYVSSVPYKNNMYIKVNGSFRKAVNSLNGLTSVPVYQSDFINGEPKFEVCCRPPYLFFCLLIILALFMHYLAWVLNKNEKADKTINFIRDNYVYLSVIFIPLLIIILVMFIRSCKPFGPNTIYIGDGFYQSYSGYIDYMKKIKEGKFTILQYTSGLVTDNTLSLIDLILSPFTFIKAKLLPEALYDLSFTLGKILPFIFGGVSLIFYLCHRKNRKNMSKHDPRLIIFGLSFVLSTYSISYFVYGGFGFLSYIPILVLALERLVYDKKICLYIIMLYFFISDPYYGFMMCVFLFLYFFTLDFTSFKDFFFKGLRFALSSIAAAGLRAYSLLPYYLGTLDYTYKLKDTKAPSFTNWTGNIFNLLSDFRSFHPAVVVTTDDSRVNYYCGLLILLIFPLYFFIKKLPKHQKIGHGLIMPLYFLSFTNEKLNYILHGFHYQSLVPNRFSIFFVFLMIMAAYDTIIYWDEIASSVKCIFPACIFILISMSYVLCDAKLKNFGNYLSIGIAGLYVALIIAQNVKPVKLMSDNIKKSTNSISPALCYIFIFELVLSSLYNFFGAAGMDISNKNIAKLEKLIERHAELKEDFVMTELIDNDNVNTSNFFMTKSISGFQSNFTQTNLVTLNQFNLISTSNRIYYGTGNPLLDSILRVRYVITDETELSSNSPYPIIDSEAAYDLRYNDKALSLGFYMENNAILSEWSKSSFTNYKNALDMQNAFAATFSLPPLYKEVPFSDMSEDVSFDPAENSGDNSSSNNSYTASSSSKNSGDNSSANNSGTASSSSENSEDNSSANNSGNDPDEIDSKNYYVATVDPKDKSNLKFRIHVSDKLHGKLYMSYNNGVNYIGNCKGKEADFSIDLVNTSEDVNISFGILDENVSDQIYEIFSKYQLYDIRTYSNGISGTIDCPNEGIVFISLPHLYGFTAYVDGEKTPIKDHMGAMGIPVTKGSHHIVLKYKRANMHQGFIITGITLLVLILYNLLRLRNKKMKKNKERKRCK